MIGFIRVSRIGGKEEEKLEVSSNRSLCRGLGGVVTGMGEGGGGRKKLTQSRKLPGNQSSKNILDKQRARR